MISNKTQSFIRYWYWNAIQCGYTNREIVDFLMYEMELPRGSVGAVLLRFKMDIESII